MIIVRDIFTAKPGMAGYTDLWTQGRREIFEVVA
jgi:hypothetical protein